MFQINLNFGGANPLMGGSPAFGPMGPGALGPGAMGANPMMGGCPGCGMDQRLMMMQQLQIMMQMMEMMMMMMGGGGFMGDMMGMPGMNGMNGMPGMGGGFPGMGGGFPGGGFPGGGFPGGGFPGGGIPGGGFPGGGFPGGGSIPGGGVTGPITGGPPGQGGSAAADYARQFLGRDSYTLRGQMNHFTAAGGRTNNCADFVSSALESTGGLRGHFVNVRGLEQALIRQGYRQVPANQAQPGDVWINHSRGHTELVSAPGGRRTIGSNNIRQGFQRITERDKNPNSGVYYSRR